MTSIVTGPFVIAITLLIIIQFNVIRCLHSDLLTQVFIYFKIQVKETFYQKMTSKNLEISSYTSKIFNKSPK